MVATWVNLWSLQMSYFGKYSLKLVGLFLLVPILIACQAQETPEVSESTLETRVGADAVAADATVGISTARNTATTSLLSASWTTTSTRDVASIETSTVAPNSTSALPLTPHPTPFSSEAIPPVPVPRSLLMPSGLGEFSLPDASRTTPADILQEIVFSGLGGGALKACDSPTDLYITSPVQAGDMLGIDTCGWMEGETVTVSVIKPQETEPEYIEVITAVDSYATGWQGFLPYDSEPGVYTFLFEGNSRNVSAPVIITEVLEPRKLPDALMPRNLFYYGFAPNESVRIFAYINTYSGLMLLQGWSSYQASPSGTLEIVTTAEDVGVLSEGEYVYIAVGEVSGQAQDPNLTSALPEVREYEDETGLISLDEKVVTDSTESVYIAVDEDLQTFSQDLVVHVSSDIDRWLDEFAGTQQGPITVSGGFVQVFPGYQDALTTQDLSEFLERMRDEPEGLPGICRFNPDASREFRGQYGRPSMSIHSFECEQGSYTMYAMFYPAIPSDLIWMVEFIADDDVPYLGLPEHLFIKW